MFVLACMCVFFITFYLIFLISAPLFSHSLHRCKNRLRILISYIHFGVLVFERICSSLLKCCLPGWLYVSEAEELLGDKAYLTFFCSSSGALKVVCGICLWIWFLVHHDVTSFYHKPLHQYCHASLLWLTERCKSVSQNQFYSILLFLLWILVTVILMTAKQK